MPLDNRELSDLEKSSDGGNSGCGIFSGILIIIGIVVSIIEFDLDDMISQGKVVFWWLLIMLGGSLIIAVLGGLFNSSDRKKEIERADKERQTERKINQEHNSRLKNLNGIYEESDTIKIKNKVYLNVSFVKLRYDEYKDVIKSPFKMKTSDEMTDQIFKNQYELKMFNLMTDKFLLNGLVKIRNTERDVFREDFYVLGQKDYSLYYDKDGKLKNGRWTGSYENGEFLGETNYKDGKLHGLDTIFYENGKLNYEWNYKDGKKHGTTKCYKDDGELDYEWTYVNGDKIE